MTRSIGLSLAAISLAAGIALAVVPVYGAVEIFPETHPQPITVRVLSGKGGQPLPHLHLVFVAGYDKSDVRQQLFREEAVTDWQGQVRLSNQIANLPWLQVWVNKKPLCQSHPRKTSFSVELMRRDGLSTPNHCGIITVDDAPGTFNVFVKGKPKKASEKSLPVVELPQSPIEHTRLLPLTSILTPEAMPSEAKIPASSNTETPMRQPIVRDVPGLRASSAIGTSRPDGEEVPTQNLASVEIPAQRAVVADMVNQQAATAQSAPIGVHFPGAPVEMLWAQPSASSEPARNEPGAGQSFVFVPAPALPDVATRTATRKAEEKTTHEWTKQLGDKQRRENPAVHFRQRVVRHARLVSQKSKPRHQRAKVALLLCPAQPVLEKPMSVAADKPPTVETTPPAVGGNTAAIAAPTKAANKPANAPAPTDATYKPKPAAGVKLAPPTTPAPVSNSTAHAAGKPKP